MVALLKMPLQNEAADGSDRRLFPRRETHINVMGRRLDHSIKAHRFPHLSLAMRDVSLGGLSAIAHTPLDRGERLAVSLPPEDGREGWDAQGRVIRCEPGAVGYRVAVEFDPLPMAA
jgi:hypothetical protein